MMIELPAGYAGAPFLGCPADYPDAFAADYRARNAAMQPAWVRHGWRSRWEHIEVNGWGQLDQIVALNAGRKLILMAVCDNSRAREIADFNARFVGEYLAPMAERYRDQAFAIEIWNEPSLDLFATNAELIAWLADLFARGAAAVRAVAPRLKILAPAWADYRNVETARLADAWAHVDGLSWHYYDLAAAAPDSDQWDAGNLWGYTGPCKSPRLDGGARHLRGLIGGADKLMVVDELGLYGARVGRPVGTRRHPQISNLTATRGAARAAKALVLYRAAGVDCILPHQADAQPHENLDNEWPCWENDGTAHPKLVAFLRACHELRGSVYQRSVIEADRETHYFDDVVVSWRHENAGEEGELPVYVRVAAEQPEPPHVCPPCEPCPPPSTLDPQPSTCPAYRDVTDPELLAVNGIGPKTLRNLRARFPRLEVRA